MPGGGGGSRAVVYGELPGLKPAAQTYLDKILAMMGSTSPAEGWIQGQAAGQQALSGAGRAAQLRMLSPGWAEETGPGLEQLFSAWRRANEQSKADTDRAVRMQFGGAGQTFSSPMIAALAKARTAADTALAERTGGTQYQDYARKQNIVAGLAPGATEAGIEAAQAANQLDYQKLQALLQYIMAAKGQLGMTQGGSGGGVWDTIAKLALFGATGGLGGLGGGGGSLLFSNAGAGPGAVVSGGF